VRGQREEVWQAVRQAGRRGAREAQVRCEVRER